MDPSDLCVFVPEDTTQTSAGALTDAQLTLWVDEWALSESDTSIHCHDWLEELARPIAERPDARPWLATFERLAGLSVDWIVEPTDPNTTLIGGQVVEIYGIGTLEKNHEFIADNFFARKVLSHEEMYSLAARCIGFIVVLQCLSECQTLTF